MRITNLESFLRAERVVGDGAFAVLLADDLITDYKIGLTAGLA